MILVLRTTANREDQVMDFAVSNIKKKRLDVYSIVRPHGLRGYILIEAKDKENAEQACYGVPYARGLLSKPIQYSEIEHMLEQAKAQINIQKNDIVIKRPGDGISPTYYDFILGKRLIRNIRKDEQLTWSHFISGDCFESQ